MNSALNTLESRLAAAEQALDNHNLNLTGRICQEIISEDPSISAAWMLFGKACQLGGKLREAIECYSRTTQIDNRNAEAYRRLGNTLLQFGQPKEAVNSLEVACYLTPEASQYEHELVAAYNYICEQAFSKQQKDKNIRNIYRKSVWSFCDFFNRQCEYKHSYKIFEELLAKYPNNFMLNYKLAEACMFDSNFESAVKYYTLTMRLEPEFPEACAGLAQVYESTGETAKALEILSRFIKRKGNNAAISLVYGKLCQQNADYQGGLSQVEKALNSSTVDRNNSVLLHFQAGKLSDSLKDYDRAFAHYTRGNDLKGSQFDRQLHRNTINALITTFDRKNLDSIAHSSRTGERQIFIVGMMRSGTSLTEQILASHPDIHAGGESYALGQVEKVFTEAFESRDFPGQGLAEQQKLLDELSKNYLDLLIAGKYNSLRVTDKMMYNYLRLHLVELLSPQARIIHCTRDPVDTCLSCYFNNFAGEHGYTNSLDDLGFYYKEYQRLMGHWKTTIRNPLFELPYEELVTRPEETTRALVKFCGLPWTRAVCDSLTTNAMSARPVMTRLENPSINNPWNDGVTTRNTSAHSSRRSNSKGTAFLTRG